MSRSKDSAYIQNAIYDNRANLLPLEVANDVVNMAIAGMQCETVEEARWCLQQIALKFKARVDHLPLGEIRKPYPVPVELVELP